MCVILNPCSSISSCALFLKAIHPDSKQGSYTESSHHICFLFLTPATQQTFAFPLPLNSQRHTFPIILKDKYLF